MIKNLSETCTVAVQRHSAGLRGCNSTMNLRYTVHEIPRWQIAGKAPYQRQSNAILVRRLLSDKCTCVLHKNEAENSVKTNLNSNDKSAIFRAKYLIGNNRQWQLRSGGCCLTERSCIHLARERSSKLRSGLIHIQMTGQPFFEPST
jgi:hypothetical protein